MSTALHDCSVQSPSPASDAAPRLTLASSSDINVYSMLLALGFPPEIAAAAETAGTVTG